MVIQICKLAKNQKKCNHAACAEHFRNKSDVMSDSLFTFLDSLAKSHVRSSQRRVFLTIKQYKIKDIYPSHPEAPHDPTHILIFCLRWVSLNKFQPIGGILYKPEEYDGSVTDLGKTLGEFIKAYLWSMNLLNLTVMAIVSPPDDYFKIIIRYLSQSADFETGESPITFFSEQFKNVGCIYDAVTIQQNFQKVYREHDILFYDNGEHLLATWAHIRTLLKGPDQEKIRWALELDQTTNIFQPAIVRNMLIKVDNGNMTRDTYGSAVLIDIIINFIQFMEVSSYTVEKLGKLQESWDDVIKTLESLRFKPESQPNNINDINTMLWFMLSVAGESYTKTYRKLNEKYGIGKQEDAENSNMPLTNLMSHHVDFVFNDVFVDKSRSFKSGKENKDVSTTRTKKPYSRPDSNGPNSKNTKSPEAKPCDTDKLQTDNAQEKPFPRKSKKKSKSPMPSPTDLDFDEKFEKIFDEKLTNLGARIEVLRKCCKDADKPENKEAVSKKFKEVLTNDLTYLISSSKMIQNSLSEIKNSNSRIKNAPYSRPTKENKLHTHHPPVKHIDSIGEPEINININEALTCIKQSLLNHPDDYYVGSSSPDSKHSDDDSEDMRGLIEAVNETISSWSDDDACLESPISPSELNDLSYKGKDSSVGKTVVKKEEPVKEFPEKSEIEKHTSVKRGNKPYTRPDSATDMKAAQAEKVDQNPNTINFSLKECTNLINKMKIERPTPEEDMRKQTFEEIKNLSLKSVMREFESHICVFEYISCIRTVRHTIHKLAALQSEKVFTEAFTCKHTDYFVNLIKKDINQLYVPETFFDNIKCDVHDKSQAFAVLDKNSGNLFCLKQ